MMFFRYFFAIFLSVGVVACGGGEENATSSGAGIELHGSVGDGPIVSANVTIATLGGEVIATTTSDAQANYSVTLPADTPYPLVISASGGIDLVSDQTPSFTLTTVIFSSNESTANLNPFTTLIYRTTAALPGGLTTANLASAKSIVLSQLDFGLDTIGIADPITTPVNASNVANIIKASESLAEWLRRTTNALKRIGLDITADQLLEILGIDLSDGLLDGRGSGETTARIAATANIVAGQVLIESLQNKLEVNNSPAAPLMDSAIQLTVTAASTTTSDVPITPNMLTQSKQMINAALAFAPSSELITLASALDTIGAYSLPSAISLPNGATAGIDQAVAALDSATETELNQVIDVVATNSSNTAPEINGSAPSSVVVGQTYSFSPSVNDAEGDTLTFSIVNKPAWATFNTSTGGLLGTPTSDDTGLFGGIIISVSDGSSVSTLPPFDITVTDNTDPPLNITDTSITAYQWDSLAVGKDVYVDRSYTYASVPSGHIGLDYVKTRNDDKAASGDSFFSFSVNKAAIVYVGFDTRISPLPNWLTTWSDTGDQLVTDDATLRLYSGNFSAGTVTLGGNGSSNGSMYVVLVEPATSAGSATPFAADDTATTNRDSAVTIDVLTNDSGLTDIPLTVAILSGPDNGTATVNADNTITYTPDQSFSGNDTTINYQVTDADGAIATASISIDVLCAGCAVNTVLRLTWDQYPEPIAGYTVRFGATPSTVNLEVANMVLASGSVDPAAPSIDFNAGNDLGLSAGDQACFSISAYNSAGPSPASDIVCTTI